jgi:hypothetical protein
MGNPSLATCEAGRRHVSYVSGEVSRAKNGFAVDLTLDMLRRSSTGLCQLEWKHP